MSEELPSTPKSNQPAENRAGDDTHLVAREQLGLGVDSRFLDTFEKVTKPEQNSPTIGPYKILQKIAAGGMGIVFMAEQTSPVRRRVALKLIKAGMDSKEVIARFEAERQALALMDHPNIAKVLDAGTTQDGRPYFVMELVQGVSITEYCDREKLSIEERLELFIQACRAIQHAHQKGIIHRDVKPSNILVTQSDDIPSVKVIDFGLAKALQQSNLLTDKTMFTEFGQVLGTLQYMSPEQAEMNSQDIDTRSDVYSLGVLLYELLTGSTPLERNRFREMAFDRVLLAIREEEPPRPSLRLSSIGEKAASVSAQRKTDTRRLSIALKGDLDWIVMKAIEKKRSNRYASAIQIAEDVARYLNNDEVTARPPSLRNRLFKEYRKNRPKIIAWMLGSLMFILLLALVPSTYFWFQSSRNLSALQIAAGDLRAIARERDLMERQLDASEKAMVAVQEGADKADAKAKVAMRMQAEAEDVAHTAFETLKAAKREISLVVYEVALSDRSSIFRERLRSIRSLLSRVETRAADPMTSRAMGASCYRLEEHQNAIDHLNEAMRLQNESKESTFHPADLAFLAMSHWKLGNHAAATDFQGKLRMLIQTSPVLEQDAVTKDLLAEVDETLAMEEPK